MNVLFICSKNQWRSPTAEKIYQGHNGINARSRGTASSARRSVSANDIQWADKVFVMEPKHKQRLLANFHQLIQHKEVHVLDVPDLYEFADPELVKLIQSAVDPLIEQ